MKLLRVFVLVMGVILLAVTSGTATTGEETPVLPDLIFMAQEAADAAEQAQVQAEAISDKAQKLLDTLDVGTLLSQASAASTDAQAAAEAIVEVEAHARDQVEAFAKACAQAQAQVETSVTACASATARAEAAAQAFASVCAETEVHAGTSASACADAKAHAETAIDEIVDAIASARAEADASAQACAVAASDVDAYAKAVSEAIATAKATADAGVNAAADAMAEAEATAEAIAEVAVKAEAYAAAVDIAVDDVQDHAHAADEASDEARAAVEIFKETIKTDVLCGEVVTKVGGVVEAIANVTTTATASADASAKAAAFAASAASAQAEATAKAYAKAEAKAQAAAFAYAEAKAAAVAIADAYAYAEAEAEAAARAIASACANAHAHAAAIADAYAKAKAAAEAAASAIGMSCSRADAEAKAVANACAEATAKATAMADAIATAKGKATASATAASDACATAKAKAEAMADAIATAKGKASASAEAAASAYVEAQGRASAMTDAVAAAVTEVQVQAQACTAAATQAQAEAAACVEAASEATADAEVTASMAGTGEAYAQAFAAAVATASSDVFVHARAAAQAAVQAQAAAQAAAEAFAEAQAAAATGAQAVAEAVTEAQAEALACAMAEVDAEAAVSTGVEAFGDAEADAQAEAHAAAVALAEAETHVAVGVEAIAHAQADAEASAHAAATAQAEAEAHVSVGVEAAAEALANAGAEAHAAAEAFATAYTEAFAGARALAAAEANAYAEAQASALAVTEAQASAEAVAEAKVTASASADAAAFAVAFAEATANAAAHAATTADASVKVVPSIETSTDAFLDPDCLKVTCPKPEPCPKCPPCEKCPGKEEYTWDLGAFEAGKSVSKQASFPSDLRALASSLGVVWKGKLIHSDIPAGMTLDLQDDQKKVTLSGRVPSAPGWHEKVFLYYDANDCEVLELNVGFTIVSRDEVPELSVRIVRAEVKRVCSEFYSHEVTVSWQASGGTAPLSVGPITLKDPEGRILSPRESGPFGASDSATFWVDTPDGGTATVYVPVRDGQGRTDTAARQVQLAPCEEPRGEDCQDPGIWDLPVVPWQQARYRVGDRVVVSGSVVATAYDQGPQLTYLNLGNAYPNLNRVTISISRNCESAFVAEFGARPVDYFKGKTIEVYGEIDRDGDGAPIIREICDPDCIQVIGEEECPDKEEYVWNLGEFPAGTYVRQQPRFPRDFVGLASSLGAITIDQPAYSNIPPGLTLNLLVDAEGNEYGVELKGQVPQTPGWYEKPFLCYDANECAVLEFTVGFTIVPTDEVPELSVRILRVDKERVCSEFYSHEIRVSWQASGGTPPLSVKATLQDPTGNVLSPQDSGDNWATFWVRARDGGTTTIRVEVRDGQGRTDTATWQVQLAPCEEPRGAPGPDVEIVRTEVQPRCSEFTSHEVTVGWQVSGGTPPVSVQATLQDPTGKTLSPQQSGHNSASFWVGARDGGTATVRVEVRDGQGRTDAATRQVQLEPCQTGTTLTPIPGITVTPFTFTPFVVPGQVQLEVRAHRTIYVTPGYEERNVSVEVVGEGSARTPFTRNYSSGKQVTLRVPTRTEGGTYGLAFDHFDVYTGDSQTPQRHNGTRIENGARYALSLTLNANTKVVAVYGDVIG